MTDDQLKILAIVALVLFLVAAAFYSGIELFGDGFSAGTPLIQGLDTGKIAAIEIKSKDHTATFQRAGEEFLLKEKNNYPLSVEEINKLLIKVLEIRLSERITENADNHAELGVSEESEEAIAIRFLDEEGTVLTGIIRGEGVERRSGIYIRRIDDDTVYATDQYVLIESDPMEYVDKDLFGVEADDIARIEVRALSGEPYTIERLVTELPPIPEGEEDAEPQEPETNYLLLNVPSGRLPDEDECEDVGEYLTNLEFESVLPAAGKQLTWDGEYRLTLKSGLVYVIRTAQEGENWYMAVGAITPLQGEQISITRDESEEELKKKEALLLANDRAENFNTLNTGWIYQIAEDDADVLRSPMEDLLISEDEEEDEGGE